MIVGILCKMLIKKLDQVGKHQSACRVSTLKVKSLEKSDNFGIIFSGESHNKNGFCKIKSQELKLFLKFSNFEIENLEHLNWRKFFDQSKSSISTPANQRATRMKQALKNEGTNHSKDAMLRAKQELCSVIAASMKQESSYILQVSI